MAVRARVAAVVTAVLGVATGIALVFAPLGSRCTATTSARPGEPASLEPMRCEPSRLFDVQSEWWPMPALALIVWSAAPLLAVVGVWTHRMWLVTAALVVEATVIISFGAAPLYVPFVLLPLLATWILARRRAII